MATIDKELVKQILGADKPRHCVYLPAASPVLMVSRSKPSSDEVNEAKKTAKASTAIIGRAVLEKTAESKTLVFYFPKADKAYEPKLKRCVKEHAGLNLDVEVRALAELKNADDDKEDAPVDPLFAAYEELSASLKDDIVALRALNPELAAKLAPRFDEIVQGAKNGTAFKDVLKALGKIREAADKALGKGNAEQQAVAEKAAYKSLRDRLGGEVLKLRVLNPDAAAKMQAYVLQAEALVADSLPDAKKDYKAATKKLLSLQEFVAKGTAKAATKVDANVADKADKAQANAGKYEKSYRNTRALLKGLLADMPDARRLQALSDRMVKAAGHARVYEFDQAVPQILAVEKDVLAVIEERRQYLKKRETADQVLQDVVTARQPAFAPARVQHLRDYRQNAETFAANADYKTAASGIQALEDEARRALAERATFREAYLETAQLLHGAEGLVADEKFDAWEAVFVTGADQFENDGGSPSQAYDLVTTIGADIRKTLRTAEAKKDAGQKVTEMTEGTSREARRLRYKLELDGVRKALPVINGHDPETAKALGSELAAVTAAQAKSLTKAEKLLEPLLAKVQDAMKKARQDMKKGTWVPAADAGPAPEPPSLKEWSDDIDQNGVLGKVKVGKKLAAGGYGAIYKLDPDDQHQDEDLPPLVVKLPLSSEAKAVKKSLEDFRKEAALYEKIGDHPNILKCLGMRKVGDTEGLVMEAVRGKTTDAFFNDLRARAAEGELSEPEFWSTIQYTIQKTMSALAHLNQRGMAHNDIKPQNIMIDEVTGDVKVIDVGTANEQGEVVKGVDNPIFQAPEQLKKEGSSGQTDVLPVGGVAYTAATGAGFHFGDLKGMMSPFMSKIEDTMLAYGNLRGESADEMGIAVADEGDVARKVNRRGEDDPNGETTVRDPSKASARSAYTDFINAVMHPDPAKRLSAEQALNHPFLRDAMLPEAQVRAVIQGATKGAQEPGSEPERDQIPAVPAKVKSWAEHVAEIKKLAAADAMTLPPQELLAAREKLAKSLTTLDEHRVETQRYMDTLGQLIADARQKNTEVYFEDNRNLDALKKLAEDSDAVRPQAASALLAFKVAIERSKDAVADNVDPAQLSQRITELKETADAIAAEVSSAVEKPAAALFDQVRMLERLRARIESVQANTAVERRLLLKLAQKQPSPPEVKATAKQLSDHLKALAEQVANVQKAHTAAAASVKAIDRRARGDLATRFDTLQTTFRAARSAHHKLVKDYQAVLKAPRDTPEALLAFETKRNDFEAAEDAYRSQLTGFRETVAEIQAEAAKLRRQLGTKVADGVANPLNSLIRLETKLATLKGKMVV